MKIARTRSEAQKDVESAVLHYSGQILETSNRFIGEFKVAINKIEKMPGIGSLRFARELDVPNLRAYSLHNFPYLIFYLEREDYVDIVRVMHSSRDIFNLLLGLE